MFEHDHMRPALCECGTAVGSIGTATHGHAMGQCMDHGAQHCLQVSRAHVLIQSAVHRVYFR